MASTADSSRLSAGFRVGHWTNPQGSSGCTVVLPPAGNVCACDIRGSAPGSRELAVLDPVRHRTDVHAVLLTGGSAFGLAAADGVMAWCEEHGIGFRTPVATIPIVPAAVIFDPAVGDRDARPTASSGYAACEAASDGPVPTGRVGAGAGATVGKWAGLEFLVPGGLGLAAAAEGGLEARALAVVNPIGDVIAADGSVLAGTTSPDPRFRDPPRWGPEPVPGNTVLVVATMTATLTKSEVSFLAARASDGITAVVRPAHTRYDGDIAFAIAAPGDRPATQRDMDVLGVLVTEAVAAAIRAAVGG